MSDENVPPTTETVTENKPKRKRPTKKQKDYMENIANNSAAKLSKSKGTITTTTVVDTPAGSLMYVQQKKQEQEELPSEKARAFLHEFQEGARDFDTRVQRDKRYMIQKAADKLAKILIEDRLGHLVCYVSTYLTKALKPIKGFTTDRYVRKCLQEKYKDPDQLIRSKTGGTGSADTKQKMAEKRERAEDPKGVADYTLEQIDNVTNIEIAREGWKYQLARADNLRDRAKELIDTTDELAERHKELVKSFSNIISHKSVTLKKLEVLPGEKRVTQEQYNQAVTDYYKAIIKQIKIEMKKLS